MEKIYFDVDTYIWKCKVNKLKDKQSLLNEADVYINAKTDSKTDAYNYKSFGIFDLNFNGNMVIESKLDEIMQYGIDACKEIYVENNLEYNKINTDSWINVVRSNNPLQPNFYNEDNKYHIHTEISKNTDAFVPKYTYVYYIQMPDVMDGEDGVLYFKSKNGIEYWIRPEEDDMIIMDADVPHSPNNATKSSIDRIVLAGNVGFELIKNKKSII